MDKERRELLAALEHEQWVMWAGSLMVDLRTAAASHWPSCECALCRRLRRWTGLMVPYNQLPDEQKDRDRIWADKAIRIIEGR